MMDEEYTHDVERVMENIDRAEVLSVFFPRLQKALVLDVRANETDGPLVRLLPMLSSPQERLRSIGKLRPGFPQPRSLTVIPWPRYVESLVELGVWERLMGRLSASGSEDAVSRGGVMLRRLRLLELEHLASVVRGKGYHTIWSARG